LKLLVDTHVFLWMAFEPQRLSSVARAALEDGDNPIVVSVVTAWEIGAAIGRQRLELVRSLEEFVRGHCEQLDAVILGITLEHAYAAARLPWVHRDPFDRMLAAQALTEGIPCVTGDRKIPLLGVDVIW
jgi:PIN domain nuclease of toxin-antitoxin system